MIIFNCMAQNVYSAFDILPHFPVFLSSIFCFFLFIKLLEIRIHCLSAEEKLNILNKKKINGVFENKNVKFFFIRFRGVFARSQLLSLMNWNELTQTSPTEYVGSAAIWACGDFSFFRISEQRTKFFKASFVVLVVRCFCCFFKRMDMPAGRIETHTNSLAGSLTHTSAREMGDCVFCPHTHESERQNGIE